MKHIASFLFLFTLIALSSCGGNHYHDGKYKSDIFNSTMTWVYHEEIAIDGGEMNVKQTSVVDSTILAEYKVDCQQFPDRIEFKNKNGITTIARFDDSGNLLYGEYTYKKVDN